jgi:CelD/BcsL family acetyltransferase involved in cellulose biosynthesis
MDAMTPSRTTGTSISGGETWSARLLAGIQDPFLDAVTSDDNIFQCKSFMAAVERHMLAPSERLVLVGVTDQGGEPAAVFPFVRRRHLGVPVLEGLDFGIADYFAPAWLRDEPPTANQSARIWQAVPKAVPGVHAISFKKLPRLLHGRPHALSGADFLTPMSADATTLRLRGEGAPPLSPDKVPLAREARRKAKKLEQIGPLAFSEATTNDEVDAAMMSLVAFRTARFSDLGRRDALLDPRVVAFYRTMADRMSNDPPGRLFMLRAGDRTVAVVYGFSCGDVFTLIAPAITPDKDAQAGSPGLVALFRTLQWCSERGYAVFDLSVGSLSYKSRFGADTTELFEYQQALSPLGLPVVADAALRRHVRRKVLGRPHWRAALERLARIGSRTPPAHEGGSEGPADADR